MFDPYSRSLIKDLPEFEGLSGDDVTRALSKAYLSIIRFRVNEDEAELATLKVVQPYLRRVANVLIFHIVLNQKKSLDERKAAAFVAAEALALLGDYVSLLGNFNIDKDSDTTLKSGAQQARIESSLLYLISGYDACAAGVLHLETAADADVLVDQAKLWAFDRIERLCRLKLVPAIDARPTFGLRSVEELNPIELESDTIARLFVGLGSAAAEFASWLSGDENGLENASARLTKIIKALTPDHENTFLGGGPPVGGEYANVFHLAVLLRLAIPALGARGLLNVVPSPIDGDTSSYRQYLRSRAVGTEKIQGRPVLWPSAFEYVEKCLAGDFQHAVVSMPTGSGKSFIGELGVSQAVSSGWALYLAPTNALAEQVRADLRTGLRELGTEVHAFIGDQEYSIFENDSVSVMAANSVAVMTPEKCALGLRLAPEAFENCRLVVFDECHLIGDSGSSRGPVAELVVAQLMARASNARFLLMSAIIQNPDQLAEWLEECTEGQAGAVTIKWRPTRTLRAVLGVDNESLNQTAPAARKELSELKDYRKKLKFTAGSALAVGLQGAWQTTQEPDYSVVKINCDAALSVSRKRKDKDKDGEEDEDEWQYFFNADSWVNATAISLSRKLAEQGIQTLVFTPASKHYPFSNGCKVKLDEQALADIPGSPAIFSICRVLAEYELGCASQVFELLDAGISVHTALMLETEKIASEAMFKNRCAPIMFATGTLAQGLNLPAIAVVIAGSRIGDPRGQDPEVVKRRRFAQLLNAAGRAGRAGFANQGVVIAIPDKALAFQEFKDVLGAREQVDYFQSSDDSVRVESGLAGFLDVVCANALATEKASELELEVISLLAGGDESQLGALPILQRTFAAHLRRKKGESDISDDNAAALEAIRVAFNVHYSAPEWLTIAAQRAGLDFFLTLAIAQSWAKVRPQIDFDTNPWSVQNWLEEFFRLIVHIPPGLLSRHLNDTRLSRVSSGFKEQTQTNSQIFLERRLDWTPPSKWIAAWNSSHEFLEMWMAGSSIAEIAAKIAGKDLDSIKTSRTAGGGDLPKALSLTGDSYSGLSLIAGGFLSVAEQLFKGKVPLALAALPMCIKYGCNSPGTLGWFRFGVRLRRPAHLLSQVWQVPPLQSDEEIKAWVRDQRRAWLAGQHDGDPVLAATRAFITQ